MFDEKTKRLTFTFKTERGETDGMVNVAEILMLLDTWGECADCPADINGDGTVNRDDRIFSEGMTTNNNPLFNIGTHSSGANGTVDVYIRNGGAFGHAYSPGTAFDGTWHHVMFTGGEDGLLDLYIDGAFDAQFNYSSIPAFTPDTTTIGGILRGSDCCNFNGNIDDVSFWSGDLTQNEISVLASGGSALQVPEPSSALLGLSGFLLLFRRRR